MCATELVIALLLRFGCKYVIALVEKYGKALDNGMQSKQNHIICGVCELLVVVSTLYAVFAAISLSYYGIKIASGYDYIQHMPKTSMLTMITNNLL